MNAAAAPSLREVHLYGALGRAFGRVHRLAVLTPAEAVQALCAVLPGFERAFLGPDCRATYRVFVDASTRKPTSNREAISLAEAVEPVGAAEKIRIVPVVAGAKSGLFSILLGAALIFIAPYALGAFTLSVSTIAAGLSFASTLGTALIVGGIVQVLSPQRKGGKDSLDSNPSYGFDAGAVNTTQQGLPVPLILGRMVIGSAEISKGLAAEEYKPSTALPGSNTNQALPADVFRNLFAANTG